MRIQCNLLTVGELKEGQMFLDFKGRKVELLEVSPSCALVRYREIIEPKPKVEREEPKHKYGVKRIHDPDKPRYRYRTETWSLASPATPIED